MLNRRILRIKVMQNLFAYYQAKEANYLLAEDYVKNDLQPNLNLDIPENKMEMADLAKEGLQILEKWKNDESFEIEDTGDERLDNAVGNAVLQFENNLNKDTHNIEKKMLIEIDKLHQQYIGLLQLVVEFSNKNEENAFGSNKVVQFLKDNDLLQGEIAKKDISWKNQHALIKKVNKDFLLKNEGFITYLDSEDHTIEEDKAVVNLIIKDIFFGNDDMVEYFEREDLYWIENKNVLKSMVKKTIKDVETGQLLKISQNWDEDRDFFKKLFNSTIDNNVELEELIVQHSKNWKKDRLALTDVIILKMGVTEMLNFPSVPVKVSINEYIEVSKSYSTPKSKQFINGLLDKFAEVLQKEGKITKSGRGLIDNK